MPAKDNLKSAKSRAGKLLSGYIRKIAMEQTEFIQHPDKGDVMVSKAEALARIIWKNALGFTSVDKEKVGGKLVETEISVPPDFRYIQLVYDRLEGKTVGQDKAEKPQRSLADKVTEQGTKSINSSLNKNE